MTLNSETTIEPCNEATDLPTMTFDFIKINELESKAANSMIGKAEFVFWERFRLVLKVCRKLDTWKK